MRSSKFIGFCVAAVWAEVYCCGGKSQMVCEWLWNPSWRKPWFPLVSCRCYSQAIARERDDMGLLKMGNPQVTMVFKLKKNDPILVSNVWFCGGLPEVFATWSWMIWGAPEAPKIAIVVIFIPHPSRIIAKPWLPYDDLHLLLLKSPLITGRHIPLNPMKSPWNVHEISSNHPAAVPHAVQHPPSREVRWKGRPQTLSSRHGRDKTSWFS